MADSFRIGCIGRVGEADMRAVLDAIGQILKGMGVSDCGPPRVPPAPQHWAQRRLDT